MMASPSLDPRRHERFRFRTADALLAAAQRLGVDLPFDRDVGVLLEPLAAGGMRLSNRLAVQPMEACDAAGDGAPSERTFERYRRYAAGGSGLIWFEAASVTAPGRVHPTQLMLTRDNASSFERLARETRRAAPSPSRPAPFLVLQLTHSGRFSYAPDGPRRVAWPNPHLDSRGRALLAWTDEELDELLDRFVEAAALAREVGFDAVDIKACHGYLVHELLGAHNREASRYGGSLDQRAHFLLAAVARSANRGIRVAVRLNATDGIPWPHGFGCSPEHPEEIDLAEPCEVARRLAAAGCLLINVTAGIPAHIPHIGRPYDRAAGGGAPAAEHPLVGVGRLLALAGAVQHHVPGLPVVGTGYSWLRQFWPHVGAAVVRSGEAALVGLGRGAFAYPDAPLDLARQGRLDPSKCCVSCSHCSELMRARVPTGCIVRVKGGARVFAGGVSNITDLQ